VPKHLRSGTWREKRDFGHGVGYVYPHDYERADVEQQYLPDRLADRRYYRPSDEGYEKLIGDRMAARRSARDQAAEAGGPRRKAGSAGKGNAMKVAGDVMRQREEAKRATAARQRDEAAAD
jgi:hypothetical protein